LRVVTKREASSAFHLGDRFVSSGISTRKKRTLFELEHFQENQTELVIDRTMLLLFLLLPIKCQHDE